MTVAHGGDTVAMRGVADRLAASGERISGCADRARSSVQVLGGHWSGPDSERLLTEVADTGRQMSDAADRLIAFARLLREQADQQDTASGGGGSAGVGGTPVTPRRTAGPPEGARADNNDARDDHWWQARKDPDDYETDGDPGHDIEMPEGLDPDSQLAEDLMSTPQGREMLDWLRRNDIEIRYTNSEEGAWYSPGDNSITFGVVDDSVPEGEREYNDSPGTLIHEANHAQWDAEDRGLEISHDDREEYVESQIDEEIEGQVEKWAWNEQARDQGIDVPMGRDERAYRDAREEALANGATPAEAERAGREEVRMMFAGTHPEVNYTQSTDGQNYYDRHRADWDDRHDWWPLW